MYTNFTQQTAKLQIIYQAVKLQINEILDNDMIKLLLIAFTFIQKV